MGFTISYLYLLYGISLLFSINVSGLLAPRTRARVKNKMGFHYFSYLPVSHSQSQLINRVKGKNINLTSCTDLVVWGVNLPSSVGKNRLSKLEREMIRIPPFQYSVIIGLLLSDGWLYVSNNRSKNYRLGFKQKLTQSEYVLFVFNLLSHYCNSYPHLL